MAIPPLQVDLTPYLKFGADNVIAIRLDNPNNSSRWYPGGGIYRNVWLVKTDPVHVTHWGTLCHHARNHHGFRHRQHQGGREQRKPRRQPAPA